MKKRPSGLLTLLFVATTVVASGPRADAVLPPIAYDVNRSFFGVTLTGTVEIPIGNYTIQNQGSSPFSSVDLTLTVDGGSFAVNNVLTDYIFGTGQFSIMASPTDLIFVANGDSSAPADLIFSDNLDPASNNRYVIGSNGSPQFEAAYTDAGDALSTSLNFPLTFGVVPEPSSCALLGLGSLTMGMLRKRN